MHLKILLLIMNVPIRHCEWLFLSAIRLEFLPQTFGNLGLFHISLNLSDFVSEMESSRVIFNSGFSSCGLGLLYL